MAKTLNEILATADWKEITPRLLYYADKLIRRCRWRGLCVQAELGAKICVEGFSADDFVQDAIDRLLSGQRNYSHSVSLEQNLKGIIRSTIWNVNKSSRHKGSRSLKTNDPALAKRRLREFLERAGQLSRDGTNSSIRFEELAQRWLAAKSAELKASSAYRRASVLKQLMPFFKGRLVRAIGASEFEAWKIHRGTKLSARSWNIDIK
jgi:hypothetical protein